MLDTFRKGQRWLTGIFIFVIGGVFVFFLGLGGSPLGGGPAGEAVVEVGDILVSRADYLRAREGQETRLREALGDQFDSKAAAALIDSQTLRLLVDSAVMAHAAQEMGLIVTRAEVQDYLRGANQFIGEDGRFSTDLFEDWVEYTYGSQRAFLTLMKQDLARVKLRRLVYDQPIVTETEARNVALYRLAGVQLGYVTLDTNTLPVTQKVNREEMEAYLAANEEEVRAAYQERLDVYEKPEARKVRHILFAVDRTAEDTEQQAARQQAEAAMQRIVEGASFEDLALELSADLPSRSKGGDIGYLVRGGETAPELEEAAYSMEPGGEIRVIQTDSGFHVVRVDEAREASKLPFEEVSVELARELANTRRAREFAEGMADQLAGNIRDGQSLEDAARAAGVNYDRSPTLRRRVDGFMPEIGTSTDLMATAFAFTEEDRTSPRVFSIGEKRILVELIERELPQEALLEEETLSVKETLLAEKRNAIMQTWLDQHRSELDAKNELLIDATVTAGS